MVKYTQTIQIIKEISKMDINMVEVYKYLLMGIDTKDFMPMENQKGMVFIVGIMVPYIKDNSKTELGMGTANGVLEHKNIKETILMIEEMVMVSINGEAKVIIKDSLLMILDMDLVKCIGIKRLFIEDSGSRVPSVEKVNYGKMDS